jgi:segregation and condensation protein B
MLGKSVMQEDQQDEPVHEQDAPADEVIAEGSGPHDAVEVGEILAAPSTDAPVEPPSGEMPTGAGDLDPTELKHLVEALVFASEKPVTVSRLRQLTRVADVKRIERALEELATDYQSRGLVLQQVSGGYQFRTQTRYSAWVQQLIAGRPVRLSRAQLETLAIVAYRQPITRPEIDDIRGVDSSATLKLLLERALIRSLGQKEEVGRPMLYGTTREFLDFFSLGDLRELPTLREYSELTAESRRVVLDELGPETSIEASIEAPIDSDAVVEPPIEPEVAVTE